MSDQGILFTEVRPGARDSRKRPTSAEAHIACETVHFAFAGTEIAAPEVFARGTYALIKFACGEESPVAGVMLVGHGAYIFSGHSMPSRARPRLST